MSKVIRRVPAEYVTEQIGGGVICPKCGAGNWKRTTPEKCPICGTMEVPDPVRYIKRRIPGYVEVRCDCGETVICDGFTNTCDRCGRDYNWNGTLLAPRSQWGEETGESEADIFLARG
ncbi:hypothetical protein [Desulfofundulus salinus]|uniref:Uncharacterized protein n=1 Tax=Desulfofundulus salinus TaxID=2419843 RepID=A0A494WSC2_9FIRM|nr:hypothetical protein [Desulfofundulus salinum]RKO65741.1 hypothetical protein D7024_01335 [Desulfofundulus salinum]